MAHAFWFSGSFCEKLKNDFLQESRAGIKPETLLPSRMGTRDTPMKMPFLPRRPLHITTKAIPMQSSG
jgi:hypothetical protein